MRAAKVIALGTFFSLIGFALCLFVSIIAGSVRFESSHATAMSAVVGGIIEALVSPISWLIFVAAFGAAIWLTRKTPSTTPAP